MVASGQSKCRLFDACDVLYSVGHAATALKHILTLRCDGHAVFGRERLRKLFTEGLSKSFFLYRIQVH